MSVNINPSSTTNVSANTSNVTNVGLNPSLSDNLNINVRPLEPLRVSLRDSNLSRVNILSPVSSIVVNDYNGLTGLPSINGVTLKGNKTSLELHLPTVNINTKEYWDYHHSYIPEKGEIVIYSNKTTISEIDYPGLKVGDGNAYLIDLPFVGDDTYNLLIDLLTDHVNNPIIHVTPQEKTFWNNKLNYDVNGENLVFNRE